MKKQLEIPMYWTTIGNAVDIIVPSSSEMNVIVAMPNDRKLVGNSSLTAPIGMGPTPIEYDNTKNSILPTRNHE